MDGMVLAEAWGTWQMGMGLFVQRFFDDVRPPGDRMADLALPSHAGLSQASQGIKASQTKGPPDGAGQECTARGGRLGAGSS